ncbi:hypothetical protein V8F20_001261 [Naviculisporaceae sp. PSN 640]
MPNDEAWAELLSARTYFGPSDATATVCARAYGMGTKVGDPIEAMEVHIRTRNVNLPPPYVGRARSNLRHARGSSDILGSNRGSLKERLRSIEYYIWDQLGVSAVEQSMGVDGLEIWGNRHTDERYAA